MSDANDFEKAAQAERRSFFAEYIQFIKTEGKYWMIPLMVVLLLLAALVVYGGAAAPFIYTLF